jgi:ubiquinone/menaquinone biosynthesis C-methylase UbiE
VYNELFERVPDHPQIEMKRDTASQIAETDRQFGMIKRFLHSGTHYLEVGAGDCALALKVAARVAKAYAVDVSDEIVVHEGAPKNFQLIISDGQTIPVPEQSIDFAFSNQLMEHLHPDDASEQLSEIFKALRPGGRYLCITPNRYCGPHDVSVYFDDEPTGFHLKEYSNRDLVALFHSAGFRQFSALISYRNFVVPALLPIWPFLIYERLVAAMPRVIGKPLARLLIAVKFIAQK